MSRNFLLIAIVGVMIFACKEEEPEPQALPKAAFTYEKLSLNCLENCEVQFTNTSTNGESYAWYFGDTSSSSIETNPLHSYAAPGNYRVTLLCIKGDIAHDTTITVVLSAQVFVVNSGNFGQGNGTISIYDEGTNSIINSAVADVNNGAAIGAGIESLFFDGTTGYILCNSSDKVEFIDAITLGYLDNPISNITAPRYMTSMGDKGYITCWGPFSPNYTLEESYVAVMDLTSRTITDSIASGSGPEGILAVGNKIYIANSFETSITVYDINTDNSTTIDLGAAPQHLEVDGNGLLWVTLGSNYGVHPQDKVGLQGIKTSDNSLDAFVNFPGISDDGQMAINGNGSVIYFLTAEPWPGTATLVYSLNTSTKTVSSSALISGENFYGIGCNQRNDKIYVADAAAFQGAGKISVYSTDGAKLDEQSSGVGPYHFVFN